MSSKNNLVQKFVPQPPIKFFYFDPDITVEEFIEFLGDNDIELIRVSKNTAGLVVTSFSNGIKNLIRISKGEYFNYDNHDYDCVFSQTDMDKMFKRIE